MKQSDIHKVRELITALPIKEVKKYRWWITKRNQNIGWNECRLEMLKLIGTIVIDK